ncbi:retrovirus-related pol polyprotein from transposon TNT 1-94 [Tanacetum coccineum]
MNGLPKLNYVKDHLCSSCELGKAKHSKFKSKAVPSSKARLHLLHMDSCGSMRVESINGNKCILVVVDDYSSYTWTHFLRSKDETLEDSDHNYSEVGTQDHNYEPSSSMLVTQVVPTVDTTITSSSQELELLFSSMFDEYFNGDNQVVSRSFAVTDKRQT